VYQNFVAGGLFVLVVCFVLYRGGAAFLRVQAPGNGVSAAGAEAMAIFDRLLDEMTARVEVANVGLAAVLGRMDGEGG
jgi:hypothetical protein